MLQFALQLNCYEAVKPPSNIHQRPRQGMETKSVTYDLKFVEDNELEYTNPSSTAQACAGC